MKYYSNIPKGFQELIKKILIEEIRDVTVLSYNEEYIVFESTTEPEKIKDLVFLEQTFILLKFDKKNSDLKSLTNWFSTSTKEIDQILNSVNLKKRSFRLVGTSYRLSNREIQNLINKVRTNLKINNTNPDHDIRFVEKKDHSFIGIRITSSRESRDQFQFGSLRKEIAYMMLYLSEMDKNDIFIDPFAGGGLIPILRSKIHPYKRITASDIDISKMRIKIQEDHSLRNNIELLESDIHKISERGRQKYNKVVTDPPWGEIEKIRDIKGFYKSILDDIYAITDENAKVILLTPHLDIISKYLERRCKSIELLDTFFGFVSGKEVNIVKLIRLY